MVPKLSDVLSDLRERPSPFADTPCGAPNPPALPGTLNLTAREPRPLRRDTVRTARGNFNPPMTIIVPQRELLPRKELPAKMPDLNRLNTVSSTEDLRKFQTSAQHSKALSSPYLTCDSLKPSIPCREHRESAVPPPMAPLPPPLAPVPPLLCALTTAPSPPDAPSTLLTLTRAPRVPFHEHVLTPAPVAPKPLLHASAATPCLASVRAPCSMSSPSSPSTPTTKTVKGNPCLLYTSDAADE